MPTFDAGTVQADIEIPKGKLNASIDDAISAFGRLATEGGRAGDEAGTNFVRGADGKLRDMRGRFVSEITAAGGAAANAAGGVGQKAGDRAAKEFGDGGKEGGKGFIDGLKDTLDGGVDGILDKVKDKFSSGVGIGTLAGAGIGLALVAGLVAAISMEGPRAKLTAQLGLTATESGRIGGVAGKLYAANYGEGLEDVTGAIRQVIQNIDGMRDASSGDLQQITGKVMSLASAFDQDLGATTRAVGQMMRTGMAKDANEALDIIAKGFQTGADKSEDFLDTLNEYGTQFRKLGIDGKDATGLISQGLKAGARDADIVADAFKEFAIRAVDGSKLTATSLAAIGLNADDISRKISLGGSVARAATDQVLDGLRAMPEGAGKAATAVGLFGTQSEDLGKALNALDLTTAAKDLGDVAGAADQVDAAMGSTAEGGLTQIGRGLAVLADSIGQSLLPVVKPFIGFLVGLVGAVGDVLGPLTSLPGPILAAGAALAGWLLFGDKVIGFVRGLLYAIPLIISGLGGLTGAASAAGVAMMTAMGGPFALAIAAGVAALGAYQAGAIGAKDSTADFTGVIDANTGALSENARQIVANQAANGGGAEAYKKIGGNVADYVNALLGVPGAQEKVNATIEAAKTSAIDAGNAVDGYGAAVAAAGGDTAQLTSGQAEANDQLVVGSQAFKDAENAARLFGQDTEKAGSAASAAALEHEGLSAAAHAAADGMASFGASVPTQALQALHGDGEDAAGGINAVAGAAETAEEKLAPMKDTLDGASASTTALDTATKYLALTLDQAAGGLISQTVATQANDAALRGIDAATRDVASAQLDLQGKQAALTEAQNSGTATAAQLQQANIDVANAADSVKDAQDKQTTANIQVQSTAIAQATALAQTAATNGSLKAATDIATQSLQKSKDAFIAAQPEADRLTGKAQATADALFGVPAAVATQLTESGAINVQNQAHNTSGAIGDIPASHNTSLTVTDSASGRISLIQSQLDQMTTYKQITVETINRSVMQVAAKGGAVNGAGRKGVDSLPYLLAPGEHVLDDGDVDKLGGQSVVYGLRQALEQGGKQAAARFLAGPGGAQLGMQGTSTPVAAPVVTAARTASRVIQFGDVHVGSRQDADELIGKAMWAVAG